MARHLFAILDDLTANLAELKAALSPLALLGGRAAGQSRKPASTPRRAKGAAPRAKLRINPQRRAALQQQGLYMAALRPLTGAQRAQVKKMRAANGAAASIALAHKLAR